MDGDRVERTGLALVHEGEYVVPGPGSAAVLSPDPDPEPGDGMGVVNYYFPVQVEVVGSLPEDEIQRVAGYIFGELDRELATRV